MILLMLCEAFPSSTPVEIQDCWTPEMITVLWQQMPVYQAKRKRGRRKTNWREAAEKLNG